MPKILSTSPEKNLGKETEARKILQDALPTMRSTYNRACTFAVLGDKKNMLKELRVAIRDSKLRVKAKIDAEFADYRKDSDFRKLVYKDKSKKRAKKR